MSAESKKSISEVVFKNPISTSDISQMVAQRFAAIIEYSDDAIVSKDLDGVIMSWNRGAERLFGYTEDEVLGKPVTILIPPDRHNEEPEILSRIRSGGRIDHYETVRQRKDGSLVDISLSVSPIIAQDGLIVGASKIARDITEKKAVERYKDMLLSEMKHRIKNSLTLAASIASQSFGSATEAERETFTSRLRALADAHDLLSRRNWESADIAEVVSLTMGPYCAEEGQVDIAGPQVAIEARKAVNLALALYELATNAMKYGSLSLPGGSVSIKWQPLDDPQGTVQLHWRERGGPTVEKPQHVGFGSRLIQHGLASDFEAVKLEFPPEGVICTLAFLRSVPSGSN